MNLSTKNIFSLIPPVAGTESEEESWKASNEEMTGKWEDIEMLPLV